MAATSHGQPYDRGESTSAVRLAANTNAAASAALTDRARGDHRVTAARCPVAARMPSATAGGPKPWAARRPTRVVSAREADGTTGRRARRRPVTITTASPAAAAMATPDSARAGRGSIARTVPTDPTSRANAAPTPRTAAAPDGEEHRHEHDRRSAARRHAELAPLPLVGSSSVRDSRPIARAPRPSSDNGDGETEHTECRDRRPDRSLHTAPFDVGLRRDRDVLRRVRSRLCRITDAQELLIQRGDTVNELVDGRLDAGSTIGERQ